MSLEAPAGPAAPAYRPETPWPAGLAVLVALGASFAPVLVAVAALMLEQAGVVSAPASPSLASPGVVVQMMLGQILSLGLVWAAAGWRDARAETLRLAPPQTGWLAAVGYGVGLVVVIGPIEILLYRLAGLDLFTDGRWLLEGLRSPYGWAVAFAAVVLAPLWEEVCYRGFLLSALAKTRLGFWPAALLSSAIWTALHSGYSWPGLASVLMAGIGLSWIMWRTGSLRAVVVAHAVVNAVSLLLIWQFAQ